MSRLLDNISHVAFIQRKRYQFSPSEQHLRWLLQEHVDPDANLLNRLIHAEVLSMREAEKVRAKRTARQRNDKIVDYVLKKQKYKEFLTAISATVQRDHLFRRLVDDLTGYYSGNTYMYNSSRIALWYTTFLKYPIRISLAPCRGNYIIIELAHFLIILIRVPLVHS